MQKKILTSLIALAVFHTMFSHAYAQEASETRLELVTVTADYNADVADLVEVTETAIENTALNNARNLVRNIPSVGLET